MARPKKPSAQEKAQTDQTKHLFALAQKASWDGKQKPLNREAQEMQTMLAAMPAITISHPPISHPCEEKKAADRGNEAYVNMLRLSTGSLGLLYSPEALHERIREVYRLCFMQKPADMSVLNDYAAHYPVLALRSPWLADLLDPKEPKQFRFREADRCRALKALSAGFKRASNPNTGKKRVKHNDVEVARHEYRNLREELGRFYGPGGADIEAMKAEGEDGQQRARELVEGKVKEIAERVPNVQLPGSKIAALIFAGRLYEAARLTASRILNVRERDIEAKPESQSVAEEILRECEGKSAAPKPR
ncbi:MAG: hypothetical protein ACRD3D_05390 [Terriglobia bacterium]